MKLLKLPRLKSQMLQSSNEQVCCVSRAFGFAQQGGMGVALID
jgi:hypothetical protein